MTNINLDDERLNKVIGKTLHRFKNNLQTQLSLMNIQTATNRLYFDDKKVITDRMFALTYIYDLYYKTSKHEEFVEESLISLQSFILKFYEHLKSSTKEIEFKLVDISDVNVDVDDLLLLSYILLEINDFRQDLEDYLHLCISTKNKNVILKFSYSTIINHEKFYDLFESQFKILDLLVIQLKGKFNFKKKNVELSFPIL